MNNNILIFKIVDNGRVVTGFSEDTEENIKLILFQQGHFVFLIREPNEQELEFIKNMKP